MSKTMLRNRDRLLVLFFSVFAIILTCMSLRTHAATVTDRDTSFKDRYKVTLTWLVSDNSDESGNSIEIHYWVPDEKNGYKFDDRYKTISTVAGRKGKRSDAVYIPGPPQSITVNVRGSEAKKAQYHLTSVDVTPIGQVANTGLPASFNLWEGSLGAGMAAGKELKTISSSLIFNYYEVRNVSTPFFSDWVEPTSSGDKSTDLGVNKESKTTAYYKAGCSNPHVFNVTKGEILASDFYVPTGNVPASSGFGINHAIAYDCYGVMWPIQDKTITIDNIGKNLQISAQGGKYYLNIGPDANAKTDYQDIIRYTVGGVTVSKTVTIHTFDYNYTFVDSAGTVIDTKSVDYGDQVVTPEIPSAGLPLTWVCDQFADWRNTLLGPQNRNVRASLDTRVTVALPKFTQKNARTITITWKPFRQKMKGRPFWGISKVIEVQYSTDPQFNGNPKTKVVLKEETKGKKAVTNLTKLQKGQTYYIRLRISDGNGIYSKWSDVAEFDL